MQGLPKDPLLFNDWHVVCRSHDLGQKSVLKGRILGEDLVLWRSEGTPHVWQDLCTHRGSRLSLGRVTEERLVCAYHGWRYDSSGQCVYFPSHPEQKPPPTARVRTYRTAERFGYVWACIGEPTRDVPEFVEWDDPSYRKIFCGPYHYNAGGPRAVENFLDVGHFPFVHGGLLGDEGHAEISDYEVELSTGGIEARNVIVWQPDPDGTGRGTRVNYTYRTLRPLTAYLSKSVEQGRFSIQLNVTPSDESHSVAWMCIAVNYGEGSKDPELRAFQDMITGQDVPVVESQRPEKLPLDLQAELHLKSDRIAVAYRRWLRQLGLTFGTA